VAIERALTLAPSADFAWTSKVEILNSLGRFDEALQCAAQALSLDKLSAAAWNTKAEARHAEQQARSLGP
jgi:tetratricopeptide (TPR) repeat protein